MSGHNEEEFLLLGLAVYAGQRVEFALYGIAAHASNLPAALKEKRFRTLTPETFLRGDASELKSTLGQLVTVFGDSFLINTPDLFEFYQERNLIAHNFFRTFHTKIRGAKSRTDPCDFLRAFLKKATYWEAVLQGLLQELIQAAAAKEGRQAELRPTRTDCDNILIYREHVARFMSAKVEANSSP